MQHLYLCVGPFVPKKMTKQWFKTKLDMEQSVTANQKQLYTSKSHWTIDSGYWGRERCPIETIVVTHASFLGNKRSPTQPRVPKITSMSRIIGAQTNKDTGQRIPHKKFVLPLRERGEGRGALDDQEAVGRELGPGLGQLWRLRLLRNSKSF